MKQRVLNIVVALDVLFFAFITLGGAKRGETISSAAWSTEGDGKLMGRIFRPTIDFLLSWAEEDHCAKSWLSEQQFRKD